eukprot:scaffold115974_cov63-Phaeocystis_antarctica.AAC.5
MRRHLPTFCRLAAVLAGRIKGSNRPLSCPAPVALGQQLAALGAAARINPAPAIDAHGVALVALVHFPVG